MRLLQALLNAASLRVRGQPLPPEVRQALEFLEGRELPGVTVLLDRPVEAKAPKKAAKSKAKASA